MSEINVIKNTFHCPNCTLIYTEGDTITTRTLNEKIVHDCDNCDNPIELNVKDGKATIK